VSTPSATPLRISATDGFSLAANTYAPASGGSTASLVLIAPATGVVKRLYDPFATFLAAHGFEVLTWDWRGTGESRPPSLRGFHATMTDWAELDLGGALAWAAERASDRPGRPGRRVLAVGHSFGGQALGLAPGGEQLAAALTVAAQSGYWGHWPRPRRYLYAALWYLAMPGLAAVLDYFPSRRLGLGEDLPRGVAQQWARWCRSPRYLENYAGHRRLRMPMLALSFADDPFAPRPAVEALHREYAGATVSHRHLRPADVGAPRIGHFGFFKPGLPALWADVAAWLERPTT
jgi:predicted alpha/beta hydrolase